MSTYQLNVQDVEWSDVAGGIVALHVPTGVYLSLNPAGVVLWRRLLDDASVDELVDALLAAFDVAPAQAFDDVEAFLKVLDERSLLSAR